MAKGKTKLFVKVSPETKLFGIAGCEVRYMSGLVENNHSILNVMVVDTDGCLDGPYVLTKSQIEERSVRDVSAWYRSPLVWLLLMVSLIVITAGLLMVVK